MVVYANIFLPFSFSPSVLESKFVIGTEEATIKQRTFQGPGEILQAACSLEVILFEPEVWEVYETHPKPAAQRKRFCQRH